MRMVRYFLCVVSCFSAFFCAVGQRTYTSHSVLSAGSWYKISTRTPGMYKIDVAFLNNIGINTSNLQSSAIRLFGNGGAMLPEANIISRIDDLLENAIEVIDGGDGVFNGNDYFIFYTEGPDRWKKDSINKSFTHSKNLYSDNSFYFLNIAANGKRVQSLPSIITPGVAVNSFSERVFHELDTVNFLSGSKEWYGEELSGLPGRTLTKNFSIPVPNLVNNSNLQLRSSLVARSAGIPSRFDIRINNTICGQPIINAVPGGQYDVFANSAVQVANSIVSQQQVDISYTYVPGSFNSQGWINWFELFGRRKLAMTASSQLLFRDWESVGNANAEYTIQNATNGTEVWDITEPLNPARMIGSLINGEFRFINTSLRLREYIAFNQTDFFVPAFVRKINNQDLHQTSATDFIIISYPAFINEATRLAAIHQAKHQLRTIVVSTEQVFNEFSSGSPDPTAMRDYVKMYYDKYGSTTADKPKYLLLFGDASFDYKNRLISNTNLVPAYENNFSLDPLSTYTSDDFFGFLDDNEDINSGIINNLLDLGIGRIPSKTVLEARNMVDKIETYLSPQSFGPWRNNLTFIADDEDNNLHLQDAETITATAATTAPEFNQQKIYLDAYRQESGAGGSSYPQATQASNNQVYNGTLIWNYNGHGGPQRLAEETILDRQMVDNWNNPFRLPLFITATCDFAPFDNPAVESFGENILLRAKTGGIALMTTTRIVFAFSNRIINDNYMRIALQPDANGRYKSLGDAVKETKNYTYQTSPDITNNRKFTLLGDPALTLGFPTLNAVITKINGFNSSIIDTLSAGENVKVEGQVTDQQGVVVSNFNGQVFPSVFDKVQTINTLANDPASFVVGFQQQNNLLFKGKASVTNGNFSFQFKVPKDINLQYGNGRLSLYATDSLKDANGIFTNFKVGGVSTTIVNDQTGPEIKAFLNDELFVNGGLVNEQPVLILKLSDSSGINTTRSSIGHELLATIDNDNRQYFVLNDFYEADLNSYQSGKVKFQLPRLSPGAHTIRIKAWDVMNNSSEKTIDFVVADDTNLELSHVLNYPNPFTTKTSFWFEHNKPGQSLQVHLTIMTITGRIVKTFSTSITTAGNRSTELQWDGRDDYGNRTGRGVYIYQLSVTSPSKKSKAIMGKLVIL